MVIKVKNGYKIKSHLTGHIYPKVYRTKKEALKRILQMQMFKHIKLNRGR